jgi:hypothetical protein
MQSTSIGVASGFRYRVGQGRDGDLPQIFGGQVG